MTRPNINLTFSNSSITNNRYYLTSGLIDLKAINITYKYNNFSKNGAPNIYYWDPVAKDIATSSANLLNLNPLLPTFGVIYANLLANMTINIINNLFSYNIAKYGSCIVISDSQILTSLLGFNAKIISVIFSFEMRCTNESIFNCSGPIPSSGEIMPPST